MVQSVGEFPCCATLHAERLHDSQVWNRVRHTLDASRMPWTVFVEPLDARIRGIDLRPQLDWLAEHGHEVAMHVHHRPLHGEPGHTTGYEKRQATAGATVPRCMDEATEYLTRAGHVPVGFVAGTWLLLDSVFEWLACRGFRYDCTMRAYPHTEPDASDVRSTTTPAITELKGVVEVPTTASLRQQTWAELRGRHRAGSAPYDLFYLHDYDLLDGRKRLAVRITAARRRHDATTVNALVASVLGEAR